MIFSKGKINTAKQRHHPCCRILATDLSAVAENEAVWARLVVRGCGDVVCTMNHNVQHTSTFLGGETYNSNSLFHNLYMVLTRLKFSLKVQNMEPFDTMYFGQKMWRPVVWRHMVLRLVLRYQLCFRTITQFGYLSVSRSPTICLLFTLCLPSYQSLSVFLSITGTQSLTHSVSQHAKTQVNSNPTLAYTDPNSLFYCPGNFLQLSSAPWPTHLPDSP